MKRLEGFGKLLLEIIFLVIGGLFIFPLLGIVGFLYTLLKHIFVKRDYSISKQLTPMIRSINLASDGLANAGAGELLNDVFKIEDGYIIRYGKWYQTISAVTGALKVYGKKDTWLRRFLKILGKYHCEQAMTDEWEYYLKSNTWRL